MSSAPNNHATSILLTEPFPNFSIKGFLLEWCFAAMEYALCSKFMSLWWLINYTNKIMKLLALRIKNWFIGIRTIVSKTFVIIKKKITNMYKNLEHYIKTFSWGCLLSLFLFWWSHLILPLIIQTIFSGECLLKINVWMTMHFEITKNMRLLPLNLNLLGNLGRCEESKIKQSDIEIKWLLTWKWVTEKCARLVRVSKKGRKDIEYRMKCLL